MHLTFATVWNTYSSDLFYFEALIFVNLFGIVLLSLMSDKYVLAMKQVALIVSLKLFVIALCFAKAHYGMLAFSIGVPLKVLKTVSLFGMSIPFCCDSISLSLVLLTAFLTFICIAISLEMRSFRRFALCFLGLELLLFIVWTVYDLFVFYVMFESVLVPMFIIIVYWGSRARRVWASYMFFMYTVIGSLPMLLAVLYIYSVTGTTNLLVLQVETLPFSLLEEQALWLALFLAFAVKVPIMPFHLWLPEAHVEAPTAGSVILAGVLLKLGSYGLLRFLCPLFSNGAHFFVPFVQTLAVCSIVYASLTAMRQNDLKRVIAYASIAHMNLIVLGAVSTSVYALSGVVFQMISHGLVASLLFLMVGILYDRSGTRLIANYSGLATLMPTFATYFLVATLANMAFPGSCNFIGEILLFVGIFKTNLAAGYLSALGIFLVSTYSIWLYNRAMYGNLSSGITSFTDMDRLDVFVVRILLGMILGLGLYPHFVTTFTYLDVVGLVF